MSSLTLLEALNFNFSKFEPFLKSQICWNSKLRVSEVVKMAIFKIPILPKLVLHKIEQLINSWIVELNFTFWKFLEHSALFGNQKFKYARCQKFIISGFYVKVIFLFQGIWQHWQVLATICYKYMWCVSNAFLSLITLHFLSCSTR